MRPPSTGRLMLASGLVLLSVALIAPVPFRLEPTTEITAVEAGQLLVAFRRSITDRAPAPFPAALEQRAADRVPLVLTAWRRGKRHWIRQSDAVALEDGYRELAELVTRGFRKGTDPTLRLQLDLVTARAWVPADGVLFSLAFVEGRDGVSGVVRGRRVYVPPSELIRVEKYGSFAPLPGYDARFRIGIDAERVVKTLHNQSRQIGNGRDEVTDLARFRALTVVEGHDLAPRRLLKGTTERPPLTRARLDAAILAGGEYLTRALGDDGVFHYLWNPVRDRDIKQAYNWPRHAGVSYSLALVGRLLERPEFVEAAGRALVRFEEQLVEGPDGSRCLFARERCYLGSSALGLLALAEYRIASGDARFDDTARKLAAFMISMRREDGFFYHDWYPETGIDRELMKLYASQQAVFALARYARATGDQQALEVAEDGMDFLAGPYWDHFLGTFFFGQEHWTCLAAEEVYSFHAKPEYAELCHGIGSHYDHIIHGPGDTPYVEDEGGMSITHLFTPHLGGTATAAEAMVSAVLLGEAAGREVQPIVEQLKSSFAFLIKGQVTVDDAFWMARPELAVGGFFETQTKPAIRIDNVQHAISAMVRGRHLLPESEPSELAEAARAYQLSR